MYKKISLSALVFGALLSMNGCGGGGGTIGGDPVSSQSISGVAVDDLILNGVVKAKDPSGNLLASGRTSDNDGTYKVNVNYTGVLLVNVTCDENSTMYNPDTKIETACGADVNLNSLGTVTAGTDLTLNISPLTEIVYQRAEALAGGDISNVDASDVEDARTEIGLMFSVDPLAGDPTAGTYADIVGTIHTLADSDPDTSVMDITNLLAEDLADGEADGAADATLSALVQVMADENLTNNLVDTNGTYIPPANPASLSDIDEAKALFTELRTQAMSVIDYTHSGTPGFLDTEAASMEVAVNDVVLNVGIMGEYLNFIANDISYMMDNNLTTFGAITQTSLGNWEYYFKDQNGTGEWSGTISIPEVLLGTDADTQLYTPGTLTMTVDGTLPLDYVPVIQEGIVDSQSFNGTLTVVKKTGGADITLTGEVASNGTTIKLTEANAEVAYTQSTADEFGNTKPVMNYFKLHNITMQGIVGGYIIDGSIIVNSYAQNAGLAAKGVFEEIISETGVGGQVTCSDGLSITPYADSLVQVTLDSQTYDVYTDFGGYFHTILSGEYTYYELESSLMNAVVCPTGSAPSVFFNYLYIWSDANLVNNGWLPNDITFAGAISKADASASIEGTLNAKWLNAATMVLYDVEDPELSITFNGKLQMPERPEMLLALSFENNATHNTLGASYNYDTTVINMSALFDTDMNNGDVVITTHTGLRADINIVDDGITTAATGTITKDGGLVGTLEERLDVPVVAYTDGSFESLP